MHTLPPSTPVEVCIPCGWESLPLEVLCTIASHLTTAKELCLFGRISHASRYKVNIVHCDDACCNDIAQRASIPDTHHSVAARDERLWKHLCISTFAVPENSTPPSWKELYAFNHEVLRMCLQQRGRSSHTAYEYGHRGYLHVRVRV